MTIYWPKTDAAHPDEGEHKPAATAGDDSGLAFEVPVEVLRRHGARVLEPSTARNSAAGPALRPTAYVSSVLLIPREELAPEGNRDTLNSVLGTVGMRLPIFGDDQENSPEPPEAVLPPAELETVPIVLRSLDPLFDVDAWTAVQAFRGQAVADLELARSKPGDPDLERRARKSADLASRISLDHLMFASSWNGDLGGVPGPIQGFVPPFGSDTVAAGYLVGPVAVELPAIAPKGGLTLGRPAVVAVLDTGIGQNTWLGIEALNTSEPDLSKWPTGNYVKVDTKIQEAVKNAGLYLQQQKHPVEVITHPKDEPLSRNPLVGTQAWCFGHGQFCAGIVAQIAPEATVLAVRVMGTDGVARESAVVAALQALVRRIDGAPGVPPRMVDIVSLSMGFPFERTEEEQLASPLAVEIANLRGRGVLVVAAAGNSASSQPFFPASLSTVKDELTTPPVISVGALNPNGSKALFTNEGPFVTCYATGTNVISTFPQDANASRQPAVQVPAVNRQGLPQYRQSPDVDDHSNSPFAVWTGSSFSAPHVAAHLANALHGMTPVASTSTTSTVDQAMKHAKDAVAAVQEAAQPQVKPSATPPASAP